jgi:hypothetical protein
MIKRKCVICNKTFYTYPCRIKIGIGKYCSRKCYEQNRNKAFAKSGIKTRFKKGHKPSPNRQMPSGKEHRLWKGENVGYRGLHYWLRRIKGIPQRCEHCGLERTTPKSIHWANIDHQYRRNPDDYIALCKSCHKLYDLKVNPMSVLGS